MTKPVGTHVDKRNKKERKVRCVPNLATKRSGAWKARVAERTRIARELHDTLLQRFNGLIMRLQTICDLIPTRPDEARELLGHAIDHAAKAVTDAREAVQALRTSVEEPNGLAAAIGWLGEELSDDTPPNRAASLRITVEGSERPLHPVVRDEVWRIAGEALRNARQHSQCTQIEVEIRYNRQRFRLCVRDNGIGIHAGTLAACEREGHYGLCGMRERAELIGGKLNVWSGPGAGTEVELTIAASHAYTQTVPASKVISAGRQQ